jgi:L-glutamine-phosphate cytidylyltransferase
LALTAIILAAGRGSRLHPYTENCPKSLTEFGGTSLIERQISTLRSQGVDDIIIATGYKCEMFTLPGVRKVHNPDWGTTNMVETLFCGENLFGDDLIVTYGDIIYEPRVLRALLTSPHQISVVIDSAWRSYWEHRFDDPLSDAESLRLDEASRIIDIGSEVDDIDDIQAQYIGLMRFCGGGVQTLKNIRDKMGRVHRDWMDNRSLASAFMTDLLMEIILNNHDVHGLPISGGWLEFDTVTDYETACTMVEDGSISRFFDPAAK